MNDFVFFQVHVRGLIDDGLKMERPVLGVMSVKESDGVVVCMAKELTCDDFVMSAYGVDVVVVAGYVVRVMTIVSVRWYVPDDCFDSFKMRNRC